MKSRVQLEREFLLLREIKIRKARKDFWEFCKLRAPDFYKESRWHLKMIAKVLQALYEKRLTKQYFIQLCNEFAPAWFMNTVDLDRMQDDIVYEKMQMSVPPRHGKSRTLVMFTAWCFGVDRTNRVITASYNDDQAQEFSRFTRDEINEERVFPHEVLYEDVFPETRISDDNASYKKWALDGQFFSYKGAGIGGSVTGKGGNCFPAGTMVQTERGLMDIAELCRMQNPPRVLSYDFATNEIVYQNIVATRQSVASDFTKITTRSGRKIVSTDDHRIFDVRRGFKKAFKFKKQDWLMTESVQFDFVESVEYYSQDHTSVYDIQVDNTENFFANGILVHNCLIVDDPVKDAEEAFNENRLEKIWLWYTGTFLSRQEQRDNSIMIVNMTRWSKKDICGRLLDGPEAHEWFVLKMEAFYEYEGGVMLCSDLLNRRRYESLKRTMNEDIFMANYHQLPPDMKGRLYQKFMTYEDVPRDSTGKPLFERILAYVDTADDGADWLTGVVGGVYQGEIYVLDVLYSKDSMESTEPQTADLLVRNNVTIAKIESNNGGKGFARNVERLIWERHQTRKVSVQWFHQSENKVARILSSSTFVMNHMYFPVNWRDRWPEYYKAMTEFQKEGKNKHDDAPDATTGLAEMIDVNPWATFLEQQYEELQNQGIEQPWMPESR